MNTFSPRLRSGCTIMAAAALVLVNVGCATPPARTSDDVSLQAFKRFGVISILGQDVTRTYLGAVAPLNAYGVEDFSNSGLDSYFESLAIESIKGAGRDGVPVDMDRASLLMANDWRLGVPNAGVLPAISLGCSRSSADALLLITKALGRAHGGRVHYQGIAVWQTWFGKPQLSARGAVTLVSCRDQRSIAKNTFGFEPAPDDPSQALSRTTPARGLILHQGKWTAEERAHVESEAKNLGATLPDATLRLLDER